MTTHVPEKQDGFKVTLASISDALFLSIIAAQTVCIALLLVMVGGQP